MNRRNLLMAVFIVPAAIFGIYRPLTSGRRELMSIFYYLDDIGAVCALGRAYIDSGEYTIGQSNIGGRSNDIVDELTSRRINDSIERDFILGRTKKIDSWVISTTEAELAAAICLS